MTIYDWGRKEKILWKLSIIFSIVQLWSNHCGRLITTDNAWDLRGNTTAEEPEKIIRQIQSSFVFGKQLTRFYLPLSIRTQSNTLNNLICFQILRKHKNKLNNFRVARSENKTKCLEKRKFMKFYLFSIYAESLINHIREISLESFYAN